jgi:hypothetical protein
MNHTDMIEVAPGVIRPAAFVHLAEWEKWRKTHVKRIITPGDMVTQARTIAARDMGITTHGDLNTPGVQAAYSQRVSAYMNQIVNETRQANADAAAFNARLGITAADVNAMRDEAQHGEARRRAAERHATPIDKPLPAMAMFKGMQAEPPPPRPPRSENATMTARKLAEKRAAMHIY